MNYSKETDHSSTTQNKVSAARTKSNISEVGSRHSSKAVSFTSTTGTYRGKWNNYGRYTSLESIADH